MSKFAIDEDEMDDLGEGLDSLSEVYDDVETPCPVPSFGHPSLDEAYREFADAATEDRRAERLVRGDVGGGVRHLADGRGNRRRMGQAVHVASAKVPMRGPRSPKRCQKAGNAERRGLAERKNNA